MYNKKLFYKVTHLNSLFRTISMIIINKRDSIWYINNILQKWSVLWFINRSVLHVQYIQYYKTNIPIRSKAMKKRKEL